MLESPQYNYLIDVATFSNTLNVYYMYSTVMPVERNVGVEQKCVLICIVNCQVAN